MAVTAQNKQKLPSEKIPYIKVVDCLKCNDIAISLPNPKYPAYVGFGPHVYNGTVDVQILIDEEGKVEKAVGISGHPYFRAMLERESLKARFKPKIVDGKVYKNTGIISYEVVSHVSKEKVANKLPIVNGLADYLPVPDYPLSVKKLCADGKVEVEVLIGRAGSVLQAKAISGDRVLYGSAVEAAKKVRFRRVDRSAHC